MATQILMPALSPTMTEGKLARWLKNVGDDVRAGDVIAEIETDKATMEVEAVDDGVIGRIIVPEGAENVHVNSPIAILLMEGETPAILADAIASAAKPPARPSAQTAGATPAKVAAKTPDAVPPAVVRAPQPSRTGAPASASAASTPAPKAANGVDRVRIVASPLARRLAGEAGIDLAALSGTGPHRRIVKADVEKARLGGGGRSGAVASATAGAVLRPKGSSRYEARSGSWSRSRAYASFVWK